MSEQILIERRGGLGLVTLNRPEALNTLSLPMYRIYDPALIAWERDPAIRAVLVRGAGDRAFCAGGDVVAVFHARQESGAGDYKAAFFREEYRLIRRIHRFPKPTIALMDGVTMGGGVGVSVNGLIRVVTERTVFAMPEVHIGLFPDVGASRFLNGAPGRAGLYLALTGRRIGAADALHCGFATHFVPHERIAALTDALEARAWGADAMAEARAVVELHTGDAGPASLAALRPDIDRVFSGASVEAIVAALANETAPWAAEARDAMARASPLSLKMVFRQLQMSVGMEVEAALSLEYRMTQNVMKGHDFYEGVRALLVDKDRHPHWQHSSLAEVTEAEVAACFAPIGAQELTF